MLQLEFWNGFFEPFELGWWIQYALEGKRRQNPNSSYVVMSRKTGQVICGLRPNSPDGQMARFYVDDSLYGDGTQLKLTSDVK